MVQMCPIRRPVGRLLGLGGAGLAFEKSALLRQPFALAVAIAAALVIWLACQTPSTAKGGRFLPEVENPYCSVTTYKLRGLREEASSLTDRRGRPVIIVNGSTLRDKPSYGQFLLAHECCHHTLGHVARAKEGRDELGPQAFYFIGPQLRQLELEADCCAVRLLRERQQQDGIDAGSAAMAAFGDKPTGAHYPTGVERVDNIRKCAGLDR